MSKSYTPVRGTYDIINASKYNNICRIFADHMETYGFQAIKLPILEHKYVCKSAGDDSDLVSKEMYTVHSSSGAEEADTVLRAEGTASCLRAAANAGLMQQNVKFWYAGPMFRYSRPQKDRWRELTQLGCEHLNPNHWLYDCEIIDCLYQFLRKLHLKPRIHINTLCSKMTLAKYIVDLKAFFMQNHHNLSAANQARIETNVLRAVDQLSHEEKALLSNMPNVIDYASDDEKIEFQNVLKILDQQHISYVVDPFLIRGLDYYTNIVYEVFVDGKNAAIAGGGRYKGYAGICGTGWSIGLDRILEMAQIDHQKRLLYAVLAIDKSYGVKVADILRQNNYKTITIYEDDFQNGIKKAQKFNPDYVVICDMQAQQAQNICIRDWSTRAESVISIDDIDAIKKLR